MMRKTFISYHHKNDQQYKEHLVWLANEHGIFIDCSVDTGDIDESLSDEVIRTKIRDEYLRDSTVTILLCGTETRFRKHIDWEIYSSMFDGAVNRRSGILVINLPTSRNSGWIVSLPNEKKAIYSDYIGDYVTYDRKQYEQFHPDLPKRIVDNLLNPKVRMSVVPWDRIQNNPQALEFLVEATASVRESNEYDLRERMRRQNYNPL